MTGAKTMPLGVLAAEVLRYNDAGSYTFPDRDQYPHQWNWDSAFAAIGWTHIDPERAYGELLTLVAAQRGDAMVPHIAYDSRSAAKAYRPEPDVWGNVSAPDGRFTSAITQPPIAAIALRYLYERRPSVDHARELVTRLHGWHRFLLAARDPGGTGEPVLIHPWETGRDDALEWDAPLGRIEPVAFGSRVDQIHVDAPERPTDDEYGRFVALAQAGRAAGWKQTELAANGPFRVHDSGFSVLLAAACHDLAAIAKSIGSLDIARESEVAANDLKATLLRRADDDGMVWPVDLRSGEELRVISAHIALLAMLPDIPPVIAKRVAAIVLEGELASDFGVRSLGAGDPACEPVRYWRGPVWANITWLCALGLERAGNVSGAQELRSRLLRAATDVGMREYFEASSGAGLGSHAFTWTAATVLASLTES